MLLLSFVRRYPTHLWIVRWIPSGKCSKSIPDLQHILWLVKTFGLLIDRQTAIKQKRRTFPWCFWVEEGVRVFHPSWFYLMTFKGNSSVDESAKAREKNNEIIARAVIWKCESTWLALKTVLDDANKVKISCLVKSAFLQGCVIN